MGLPLKQYRDILVRKEELEKGNLSQTAAVWQKLTDQKRVQIRELKKQIELLEFFAHNAERVQKYYETGEPYPVHLPEMYIMAIPHDMKKGFEATSMTTRSAIRKAPFKGKVTYKFGVVLDADALRRNEYRISYQYCVLKEPIDDPRVIHIPAGDYRTVVCRAWVDEDAALLQRMVKEADPTFPYVLAEEYAPFEETELIEHQVFFRI